MSKPESLLILLQVQTDATSFHAVTLETFVHFDGFNANYVSS